MARSLRTLSVRSGNLIEVLGIALAIGGLLLAASIRDPLSNLVLLAMVWVSLWYFPHCLIHFIVGRIAGITFTHYLIGSSALVKLELPYLRKVLRYLPVLGIRTDRASLRRSSPRARRLMFESGAYGSMLLPSLAVIFSLSYSSATTSALLIIMSLVNVAVTLYYSPRAGDIWRARTSYY